MNLSRKVRSLYKQWDDLQDWSVQLNKSSGNVDFEREYKFSDSCENDENKGAPSYYYMYGKRMGEKPELLKNFLGKKKKANFSKAQFYFKEEKLSLL